MIAYCIWMSYFENCSIAELVYTYYFGGDEWHLFRLPGKRNVIGAAFIFRTSVSANGRINDLQKYLSVSFYLPNRFFRAVGSTFQIPVSDETGKELHRRRFVYTLKDMEILKRRNKKDSPCLDEEDFDSKIFQGIYDEVGCAPHHFNPIQTTKLCSTKEQYRKLFKLATEILFRLREENPEIPPCTEIQKLQIDHISKEVKKTAIEEVSLRCQSNMQTNHVFPVTKSIWKDGWFEVIFEIKIDSFK